ncbi:MAG: hypothetical protein JXA36_08325 [Coriobacteriia bacterium]|nr:hypothetical protein [Coriobacteriia bacterium]
MVDSFEVLHHAPVCMPLETQFKVTSPATVGHVVPADVLVRAVQGLQQSIWLIAAAREDRAVRQRFVPDQVFRQRLTLELSLPATGSWALPIRLVDRRPQVTSEEVAQDFLEVLSGVWSAVADDDLPRARQEVCDEGYFLRLMQEFRRMLPKKGDRWALSLGTSATTLVELTSRHRG